MLQKLTAVVTSILALTFATAATVAWASPHSDCKQLNDPDRRMLGCTSVIERGKRTERRARAFAHNKRGNAYLMKGRYALAIAHYTKAIAIDPNFALPHINRGIAYAKKGEVDRAIVDFRKALEINPLDQVAKEGLARLGVTH